MLFGEMANRFYDPDYLDEHRVIGD